MVQIKIKIFILVHFILIVFKILLQKNHFYNRGCDICYRNFTLLYTFFPNKQSKCKLM